MKKRRAGSSWPWYLGTTIAVAGLLTAVFLTGGESGFAQTTYNGTSNTTGSGVTGTTIIATPAGSTGATGSTSPNSTGATGSSTTTGPATTSTGPATSTSPGSTTNAGTVSPTFGVPNSTTAANSTGNAGGLTRLSNSAVSKAYLTGWNLIGNPNNTTITSTGGPLYTYQPGDTSYETVSPGTVGSAPGLQAGLGYWAYFAQSASTTLPPSLPQQTGSTYAAFTVVAPGGQWFMIGNPYSVPVTVSNADALDVYDPAGGFQQTTTLQPGQGAFVYSGAGAALSLCPSGVRCQ